MENDKVNVFRISKESLQWFETLLVSEIRTKLEYSPHVFAIGAEIDGTACGILVFKVEDFTWDIIWLAVSDCYRRQKVAREMVGFLCSYALKEPAVVRCFFSEDIRGNGADIHSFFEEHEDFTLAEMHGGVYEVSYDEVSSCSMLPERKDVPSPFFSMTSYHQRQVKSLIERSGLPIPESMENGSPVKPVKELCLCGLSDDKPCTVMWVEQWETGPALTLLYSVKGHERKLYDVLSAGRKKLLEIMDPKEKLTVLCINQESAQLLAHIFPKAVRVGGDYAAYYDMQEFS